MNEAERTQLLSEIAKLRQRVSELEAERIGEKLLVVNTPLSVMVHAEDGEILAVSRTVTNLTGYSHQEIPNIPEWVKRVFPLDRQAAEQALIDKLYSINAEVDEGEIPLLTRQGNMRIWHWRTAPLKRFPDGRRVIISVAVDVTEHRKEKEALQRFNAELENRVQQRTQELRLRMEELQKLHDIKDEFISTVSHELRTPLTNIKLVIKLLQTGSRQADLDRYLGILERECNREIEIVNNLLDLQQVESATRLLHPEVIELEEWLSLLIQPFYQRAAENRQRLDLSIQSPLGVLTSDVYSLERIVTELLNNACKYTPADGVINVAVSRKPLRLSQNIVEGIEVVVSNTSSKISASDLACLFERFYRSKNNEHRRQSGAGLGLALVKKLVASLGGHIEVHHQGERIAFSVQIPKNLID